MKDILLIFLFLGIITTALLITEYIAKSRKSLQELSRKSLHIISCLLAAISPWIIEYRHLCYTAFFMTIATLVLLKFNLLRGIDSHQRKSWGIFFLSLAYLALILFLENHKWIITVSLVILALADSFAALTGSYFSKKYFNLSSDKKSIPGSIVFFLTTTIILTSFYVVGYNTVIVYSAVAELKYFILFAVMASVILTVFEAISSKGFDNFSVPIITAVLLYTLVQSGGHELIISFSSGMLLAGAVAFISYKVRFLTLSGAFATFLLAGFIFGYGGWKWSLPILTFFVLSSLLSKIRKGINEKVETYFEKTSVRDHMQVFANGGLGGILVIINQIAPNELFYYMYIASLAAVCADTWATEIGTLIKTRTYNILNFRITEQGISGGISALGTFGGLLGAFVISLSGFFWIQADTLNYFLLIILSGLFGTSFDSFLGATIQIQYKCKLCSKITEKENHCGQKSIPFKGYEWINNDIVNLLSGAAGIFMITILSGLL